MTHVVLNALVTTSILALVASGLYIVYGLMRVINMAHGEMLTLGAYSMVVLTGIGINFWAAIPLTMVLAGGVGFVLERGIVRHLYGAAGLSTLLATWGISIAMQQGFRLWFGPSAQFVESPVTGTLHIGVLSYPRYRLLLLAVSILVIGALIYVFKWSRVGLLIRATMDGEAKAASMGVNTQRIYWSAFVVGSCVAGLAGALLAPLVSVTPLMGLEYVVQSFLVVMVGGIHGVLGPLGGSGIVAGLGSLGTDLFGATVAQIIVLLLVVAVVFFRPNGLFGRERQ